MIDFVFCFFRCYFLQKFYIVRCGLCLLLVFGEAWFFMRKKRGQAAIEFLTTYSWAILTILLMVGALTYFDLFNTQRFVSEECSTGNQLVCVEAALFENGDFRIRVLNNHPVEIRISDVSVRRDNEDLTVSYTAQNINRGQTVPLEIDLSTHSFNRNNMESFDVVLTFGRVGGSNSYNVTGRVVTRTLPGNAP